MFRSSAAERLRRGDDGGRGKLLVSNCRLLICLCMSSDESWVTGSKKTNCLFLLLLFLLVPSSTGGWSWARMRAVNAFHKGSCEIPAAAATGWDRYWKSGMELGARTCSSSGASTAAFKPARILLLRLTNQRVPSGTCDAGALRLLAADGGEGGTGTETGVRCSAGGGDTLMSSCGSSPASSLDRGGGCNLTWG